MFKEKPFSGLASLQTLLSEIMKKFSHSKNQTSQNLSKEDIKGQSIAQNENKSERYMAKCLLFLDSLLKDQNRVFNKIFERIQTRGLI